MYQTNEDCKFLPAFSRSARRSVLSLKCPLLLCLALFASTVFNVYADDPVIGITDLPEPEGRVLIEISGNIKKTNAEGIARFDYAMLSELGLVEMTLDTPWTAPGTRFEGVLTRRLLELVGADGQEIVAEAADDYSSTIPFADLAEFDTLLALSMDGKKMRLRNKGPAWILYDAEDRPEAVESVLNSRMVWQLRKLKIQ